MTQGTSTHGEGLSRSWADAGHGWDRESGWWPTAQQPAPLQLLGLSAVAGLAAGLTLTTAWHAVADIGPHLAILLSACVAATCVRLRPRRAVPARPHDEPTPATPCRLLAQMHHELRTPLNAVIGFSEAMQHELHGPLGNARYQEYAAHITESGGLLLKASEDALAVAATMSALLADRRALRRERLPVARLLQEGWGAALGASDRAIRLSLEGCAGVEIECDRQATGQALQHLLVDAIARAGRGGTVIARGRGDRGTRTLEIVAEPAAPTQHHQPARREGRAAADDGLRLILAASLIEMQGGALSHDDFNPARWSVRIVFAAASARPALQGRRGGPTAAAAGRRLTAPACRGGFAAAAASRASAGSQAAPPA